MLRKKQPNAYLNKVSSTLGAVFLSKSAKNKKNDDRKSNGKFFSFNFSEIQDAVKHGDLKQFVESESAPVVMICSVLTFIGIIYIIVAALSSSIVANSTKSESFNGNTSPELLIEIEEVLSKLIDLRKTGNMKDYEHFLQPTMQKYCLNHLGTNFFDIQSLESFHMNLAETISFLAAGNTFSNHKSLAVTSKGGIIDAFNSAEPQHIINSAQSCPLLDALFASGKIKQTDGNEEISEDLKEIKKDDTEDAFDKQYSWTNMEEFYDLVFRSVTHQNCIRLAKDLSKENMKAFILNFYEMADIIGHESIKEEKEGKLQIEEYHNKPDSPTWKKYMVGRDGAIYATEEYKDHDQYFKCGQIENILNDKFELDENLTYTNIKIALDDRFDEWYKQIEAMLTK